ncbi:MAG: peptidoglycan DD-metalloendopeptidase family protein [Arachnia sp.]
MRLLPLVLTLCILQAFISPAHANPLRLEAPVPGRAITVFDSSATRYSAGHRGVDLSASPGDPVYASAAGTVFFDGIVAGRPTLSVDHGGGIRTTYTPAVASVAKGEKVVQGQPLGTVGVDEHCRSACLHWGLTDGVDYFDPLAQLATPAIRLLPMGSTPAPRTALVPAVSPGGLPVAGRISSRFGMRKHPVTGVWKLHDGTDIAAACGTPVQSVWAGTVVSASFHSAYGYRIVVEHDGLRSAYAHMESFSATRGDTVMPGQQLGRVGSTGLSTGCHLHWMVWRGGSLIDPLTLTG